jgi:siroheme synthase-like protein
MGLPIRESGRLLPAFLKLAGRRAVVVGGGSVAASKLPALLAAGARVTVVAPRIDPEIERLPLFVLRRGFAPVDLDGAWYAVAAATPEVNREVSAAAAPRRVFVNVVDDAQQATVYAGSVVRRGGVTVAISTNGDAPALARLLREALDALIPRDVDRWLKKARRQRAIWRKQAVPMAMRRPLLLETLNLLYRPAPSRRTSLRSVR